jgi:hypothetical protein
LADIGWMVLVLQAQLWYGLCVPKEQVMRTTRTRKPSVGDAAVKAKTGKDWASWFSVLDRAKAAQLPHKDIAKLLSSRYGVPGWWSQMITVEYEQARGLRAMHEHSDGFSLSLSKTLPVTLETLYAAAADAGARKRWFPKGAFTATSKTENKYLNGRWKDRAKLTAGFYAKGLKKAQIAIGISKLKDADEREAERIAWKAALEKLAAFVQK